MNYRLFIPSLIWLGAMILVFVTPLEEPPKLFFDQLPARSVIYGILFLGYTHTTIKSFKKQLVIEKLRQNAFLYVFISAAFIMIISEMIMYATGFGTGFSFWNVSLDMLGTIMGIGSFKLLYHSCY